MKMPREIETALEKCGVPWSLQNGSRHFKIVVGGRFVGILPHGKIQGNNKRATLNIAAQIKRAARGMQG
jgi:hypothetical protein